MFKMQLVEFKTPLKLIKLWQCACEHTPHKPLLVFNALGNLKKGKPC
jgi:hypothetical protein